MQFYITDVYPYKITMNFNPDRSEVHINARFVYVDDQGKQISELGASVESFTLDYETTMTNGGQDIHDSIQQLIINKRLSG